MTSDRLDPGGMVMANVGRIPNDAGLADAIAGTMPVRFASVFEWRVSGFNDIVAGFTSPTTAAELRARLADAPRRRSSRRRGSPSSCASYPRRTIP